MNIIIAATFTYFITPVYGVIVPLAPPISLAGDTENDAHFISRISTSSVKVTGNWGTCYSAFVTVAGSAYTVRLDTGSSDFAIPGCASLNGYTGTVVPPSKCPTNNVPTASYADGSFWTGFPALRNVKLTGTNVTALAPAFMITKQSNNPYFINQSYSQGIFGLAYKPVASYRQPYSFYPSTLFDAWVKHMQIPNRISFHACPISLKSESYVDFGSDNSYSAAGVSCSANQGTVTMPMKTFITVDVYQILVGASTVTLQKDFQTGNNTELGSFTILDSCSSLIVLPSYVYTALVLQIKASGASSYFNNSIYSPFFSGISYAFDPNLIDYTKLPTLTVEIKTRNSSLGYTTVKLTLAGRQYMQYDTTGKLTLLVSSTNKTYMTMGIPYFMAYHIDIDRGLGLIRFQQGCGCSSSTDGYPLISTTSINVTDSLIPSSSRKKYPTSFGLAALVVLVLCNI